MQNIKCGVSQGSILGPLFFILYINDPKASKLTELLLFADDTSIKSIDMTQEQLVIIEFIPVVQTSRNSQFFTKDLESGTVSLHLLQTCQAFLSLRS